MIFRIEENENSVFNKIAAEDRTIQSVDWIDLHCRLDRRNGEG
jgi:hypothetical protein